MPSLLVLLPQQLRNDQTAPVIVSSGQLSSTDVSFTEGVSKPDHYLQPELGIYRD